MSTPIAIVAGVGPGTGAEVARRFSGSYPVVLLARDSQNLEGIAEEINKGGGRAVGIIANVSNPESMKNAFRKIEQEFKGAPIAAAVFNASSRPLRAPIVEVKLEDLKKLIVSYGLFKHAEDESARYPPTLVFTGATASIKANAQMSAFASAKFAMRALSMSIAREYGPKGVHTAHVIVDGVIDTEFTKKWTKDMSAEATIAPSGIAESYWNLHTQSKRCFTNEIGPMLEKW